MEDVETRFGTSNFEIERPLTKEKSKRVIGLMKDQLGEQFIKELDGLRTKACSYLKDSNDKDKKAKDTKKCAIKTKLKFQDYKNCLEVAQTQRKINYLRKKKIDVDSLKEDQKEFVKNNKLILKKVKKDLKVKGIMFLLEKLTRLL